MNWWRPGEQRLQKHERSGCKLLLRGKQQQNKLFGEAPVSFPPCITSSPTPSPLPLCPLSFLLLLRREELVKFAIAGDTDSIRETLQRMAAEADAENAKPRAAAETRDERGNSLLALAAWHGHYDTAELLLTHYKTCDPLLEETERKGWTPVALAAFHNQPKVLRLLLEHGGDPRIANAYNSNAFQLGAQHPEVMQVLNGAGKSPSSFALVLPSLFCGVLLAAEGVHNPLVNKGGGGGGEGEEGEKEGGKKGGEMKPKAEAKPKAAAKKSTGKGTKGTKKKAAAAAAPKK
ncbi:ANKRD50, partial [Symbiodinium sp. KB8]